MANHAFRLRFALLLPLAALIACGGGSTNSGFASSGVQTGDYVFSFIPSGGASSSFTGNLAPNPLGAGYLGTFLYSNPGSTCNLATIAFTGTLVNNVLTLTSAPFSSSVATLTVQLPFSGSGSAPQNAVGGNVVITGGSCTLASTTLQGAFIPTFAGTWSGSLSGPVNGNITLQVTESAANASGQFPVTAIVTFTSSSSGCSFNLNGGAGVVTGLVSGYSMQLAYFDPNTPANEELGLTATNTSPPTSVIMNLYVNPHTNSSYFACPVGGYVGTITQ